MPEFIDACSCRIWAIDGWENKDIAKALNIEIENLGSELYLGQYKGNRHEKVEKYVLLRKGSHLSSKDCTIYGVFDSAADRLPTHMWLEHGGYIYDTIPGQPLCRKTADALSKYWPSCEENAQRKSAVGVVAAKLTKRQSRVIKAANGHWAPHPSWAGVEAYSPADQVS